MGIPKSLLGRLIRDRAKKGRPHEAQLRLRPGALFPPCQRRHERHDGHVRARLGQSLPVSALPPFAGVPRAGRTRSARELELSAPAHDQTRPGHRSRRQGALNAEFENWFNQPAASLRQPGSRPRPLIR